MPNIVSLCWYEEAVAKEVGKRRQEESLKEGKPDAHGFLGNGLQIHVEGACGEMAFAKWSGRYWSCSVNTYKDGGDVGKIQVRTRSKSWYELIVRKNARDDDLFVLVTRQPDRDQQPTFDIVGWYFARDAKQERWLQTHGDRPAAYFVPQIVLKDPDCLRVDSAKPLKTDLAL